MNEQYINHFNETLKIKTSLKSVWLGISSMLCFPLQALFGLYLRPYFDNTYSSSTGKTVGFVLAGIAVLVTLLALIANINAYRKGARAWVLWLGFLPTIIMTAFWLFVIIGNFVFAI